MIRFWLAGTEPLAAAAVGASVEYLLDPNADPLDRDTVQSEQEEGIYRESDLELLT